MLKRATAIPGSRKDTYPGKIRPTTPPQDRFDGDHRWRYLSATLHGVEALLWATAYMLLNALPDWRMAVLYSLNAMTSYGHTNLALADRWHLMGALEALNGWLLFGLTTAFLFAVIDRVWMPDTK